MQVVCNKANNKCKWEIISKLSIIFNSMYKVIHVTNKDYVHMYKDKPEIFFFFPLKNGIDKKWKNPPLGTANFPWIIWI